MTRGAGVANEQDSPWDVVRFLLLVPGILQVRAVRDVAGSEQNRGGAPGSILFSGGGGGSGGVVVFAGGCQQAFHQAVLLGEGHAGAIREAAACRHTLLEDDAAGYYPSTPLVNAPTWPARIEYSEHGDRGHVLDLLNALLLLGMTHGTACCAEKGAGIFHTFPTTQDVAWVDGMGIRAQFHT